MQKHVMTVHMKEKPYKCKECTFQTATYATLNKHISLVHKVGLHQFDHHNLLQGGPSGCAQCFVGVKQKFCGIVTSDILTQRNYQYDANETYNLINQ